MPNHRNTEARRAYHREYMRRRYQEDANHRKKQIARAAISHAIRDGLASRKPCEECGCLFTEAHHEDYDKPLEVKWLCRDCHEEKHGGPGCHGGTLEHTTVEQ